jgi:hypothetical protein
MKNVSKRPVGRPRNRRVDRLVQIHGISRRQAFRRLNKPRLRMQSRYSDAVTALEDRGEHG